VRFPAKLYSKIIKSRFKNAQKYSIFFFGIKLCEFNLNLLDPTEEYSVIEMNETGTKYVVRTEWIFLDEGVKLWWPGAGKVINYVRAKALSDKEVWIVVDVTVKSCTGKLTM
jgi:hypothetical protein